MVLWLLKLPEIMLITLNKAFFGKKAKKQVIWIASGKYSSFFQILSSAWEVLNQFLYFTGCTCYLFDDAKQSINYSLLKLTKTYLLREALRIW
jgi:hypothetical protein